MAYPGQQWQQQHPQYNDNYQQSYGNQNWGPPPGAPPAGYGPVHANNDPNYPGQQYNQYGYIQGVRKSSAPACLVAIEVLLAMLMVA